MNHTESDHMLKLVIGAPVGIWDVLGAEAVDNLKNAHSDVLVEETSDTDEFSRLVLDADAAMTFGYQIPALALEQDTRLRWVHSIPAGINSILTPELIAAEHIAFTSSKGPIAPLIAEQLILLMLSLARNMPALIEDQKAHVWSRNDNSEGNRIAVQLLGKTVAVLGVGQIGQCIARTCKVGFGMKVLGMSRTTRDCEYVDEYFDRSDLHRALGESDIVVLSLPLTVATEKIIGKAELEAMKSTAFLINGGRGGLIDEDALIDAMNTNQIGGAGLDTVMIEPLPEDSPLWNLPNTIITPHSGAMTDNIGGEVVKFLTENIRRFAEGEQMLGLVHRQEGY